MEFPCVNGSCDVKSCPVADVCYPELVAYELGLEVDEDA